MQSQETGSAAEPISEIDLSAASALLGISNSPSSSSSSSAAAEDLLAKLTAEAGGVTTNTGTGTVTLATVPATTNLFPTDSSALPASLDDSDLAAALLPPIPPAPGTPDSPYRRCDCLGAMPGRACSRCAGLRWIKSCTTCAGTGRIDRAPLHAGSHPRSETCGFCMGKMVLPARAAEIDAAHLAHDEAERAVDAALRAKPLQRRQVQLPGSRAAKSASRSNKSASRRRRAQA